MQLMRTTWTEEMLADEASKYSTRSDFQRGSSGAYSAARSRGLLDKVCVHMDWLHTYWTEEMLADEAYKYSTRSDFQRGASSAYQTARKRGLLDKVCAHTIDGSPSDNDVIYVWRANGVQHYGLNVYKIGITSARLGDIRIADVANASGFLPTIVRLRKVTEKATWIEKRLLEIGQHPGFTGFDGCTEFRALTDIEVDFVTYIIDLYSDDEEENQPIGALPVVKKYEEVDARVC